MTVLELKQVTKRFGSTVAVSEVSFSLNEGDRLFVVGPSGCGKSTLLRLIAGLEIPESGTILIDQRDCTTIAPERRQVGLVFQQYALWPHLTVLEHLQFGLKAARLSTAEQQSRIESTLSMLQLSTLSKRYPSQLSGGQQQRVAVARALVLRPKILLLDEPLSNLDPVLRAELRGELLDLLTRHRLTSVFVTHDQDEAFLLADEVLVLREGRLIQQGTPRELYHAPSTRFVTSFFGDATFLDPDSLREHLSELSVNTASPQTTVAVRPEAVSTRFLENAIALPVTVLEQRDLGATIEHRYLLAGGQELRGRSLPRETPGGLAGDSTTIWIRRSDFLEVEIDA